MNTSIIYSLDYRSPKKDGTFPLLMRIIHNGNPAQITMGISLPEKDWDDSKRIIRSSYKGSESVTRLNNYLQKKKSTALDIITKLDESKRLQSLSAIELKEIIKNKSSSSSFFVFMQEIIDQKTTAGKIGTARVYKDVLGVLKSFRNGKDLLFTDITYKFLTNLELAHLSKGNAINGLSTYMRTIRAAFNMGIKEGLVDKDAYPFGDYQIKSTKTRKRAISQDAIRRIEALKLSSKHPLYHAVNMFLFSFYMRGMPFADLAQVKVANIIDGRIVYQRKKTDTPYNVKLTPEIQTILKRYLKGKEKEDYIFDIIKRSTAADQYKDVEWARKRYNKKLKKVATLCNIEDNLTSYVSRHSFATIGKNLKIPIAVMSDMLGHASIKTTEIYMDTLPDDMMDEFHQQIISKKKRKKTKNT